ncbi:MAG: TlpA family protein disulfide reductase [Cytophagales bacterium]|nr:TlpA family protein disulfide reductase [Cytophagales bacterium]
MALLGSVLAMAQHEFKNPRQLSMSWGLKIDQVDLRKEATVLHFTFRAGPGTQFTIPDHSYIQADGKGDLLKVVQADGVQINKSASVPESGVFAYTLYFPVLPEGTKTLKFGEEKGSWCVLAVRLEQRKLPGLPDYLKGKWYSTDGEGKLCYYFMPDQALCRNEIWEYGQVSFKKRKGTVELRNEADTLLLHVRKQKDGTIKLGTDRKELKEYSKTRRVAAVSDEPYDMENYLKPGKAVYRGLIAGYSPEAGFKTGKVIFDNPITGKRENHLIRIAPDGFFSVELSVYSPQTILVDIQNIVFADVFIVPGKVAFHVFEDRNNYFMGDLARVNEEYKLRKELVKGFGWKEFSQRELLDWSPEEYKAFCMKKLREAEEKLKKMKKEHTLSRRGEQLLAASLKFEALMQFLEMENARNGVFYRHKDIKKEDYPMPKLNDAYFDFLNGENLNDEEGLMVSNTYFYFINRLEFSEWIRATQVSSTLDEILEYAEKREDLSVEEKALLKHIRSKEAREDQKKWDDFEKEVKLDEFLSRHQKLIVKFSENNQKTVTMLDYIKYVELNAQKLSEKDKHVIARVKEFMTPEIVQKTKAITEKFGKVYREVYAKHRFVANLLSTKKRLIRVDSIVADRFGGKEPLAFQLIRMYSALKMPLSSPDRTEREIQEVKSWFSEPKLKNYLDEYIAEGKRKLQALENSKTVSIYQTGKVESDKLFDSMMERFRGKVVLVDFWATWCGPCMQAHADMKTIKEELEGKDVVFVYITDPSSPEGRWKRVIAGIKGEHYRVSKDEWNTLSEKFQINGIPHYALVGRDGKVLEHKLERGDRCVNLKNSILKALRTEKQVQ